MHNNTGILYSTHVIIIIIAFKFCIYNAYLIIIRIIYILLIITFLFNFIFLCYKFAHICQGRVMRMTPETSRKTNRF